MDLPPWARTGAHVVPLTYRGRATLSFFSREGRSPAYMIVGNVNPHDQVPIHLLAHDQNGVLLGSTNLWAKARGTINGWNDDDWGLLQSPEPPEPPAPEIPSLWSRLLLDEP